MNDYPNSKDLEGSPFLLLIDPWPTRIKAGALGLTLILCALGSIFLPIYEKPIPPLLTQLGGAVLFELVRLRAFASHDEQPEQLPLSD